MDNIDIPENLLKTEIEHCFQVEEESNDSPVANIEKKEVQTSITKEPKEINIPDSLWKIIGRYDFYIGTTNAKATMMIAFNTFILSGIILKMDDLLPKGHHTSSMVIVILLSIIAISCLIALYKTFRVIHPFLKSEGTLTSNIFFADVAKQEAKKYLESIKMMDEEKLIEDLGLQSHAVAQAAKSKFDIMTKVLQITVYGQLIPLAIIIIINCLTKIL